MMTKLFLLELMLVLIAQTTVLAAFIEPQVAYNSQLGPTSQNSHAKVQADTSADIPQSIISKLHFYRS